MQACGAVRDVLSGAFAFFPFEILRVCKQVTDINPSFQDTEDGKKGYMLHELTAKRPGIMPCRVTKTSKQALRMTAPITYVS